MVCSLDEKWGLVSDCTCATALRGHSRAILLEEAYGDVDDNDGSDDTRLDPVADAKRERHGENEHNYHGVCDLLNQNLQNMS